MKFICFLFFILALAPSCTIYRSPERKDFESTSSQFNAQNLKQTSCSNKSIKDEATSARLMTVLEKSEPAEFLWEYQLNNQSYYESDNLKGVFCLYELNQ